MKEVGDDSRACCRPARRAALSSRCRARLRAPGRFSITVVTPCAWAHFSATIRVNTSPPPPAGNGTMNLICREDCADALETDSAAANAVAATRANLAHRTLSRTAASAGAHLENSLTASGGHGDDGGHDHAVHDRVDGCADAPVRAAAAGPR